MQDHLSIWAMFLRRPRIDFERAQSSGAETFHEWKYIGRGVFYESACKAPMAHNPKPEEITLKEVSSRISRNVDLDLPKISLTEGHFGQSKSHIGNLSATFYVLNTLVLSLMICFAGALRRGSPCHWSRDCRKITVQNEGYQMGGCEVTGRYSCFFRQEVSGHEVTGWQITISVFHGTLCDPWIFGWAARKKIYAPWVWG